MRSLIGILSFCTIVVFIFCLPADLIAQNRPAPEGTPISAVVEPNPVENGHTVLLEIDIRGLGHPAVGLLAKFNGKVIPVFNHPLKEEGIFIALIGISYYSDPGAKSIKLEWTDSNGYHSMPIEIEVIRGEYKKEKLRVPKKKVSPSVDDRRRITAQRKEIKAAYAIGHPIRLWEKPFWRPTKGKITSPFGTRRLLNGKLKSYHNGVDFRAPTGTPIYAVNDGIVRFTKDLFYSGKHVIVDHGLGVYTTYSHLSKFSVTPDQFVGRGQEIGLAGSTGRSNGPHLHLGAKINGVTVNPLQLMQILHPLVDAGAPVAAKTVGAEARSE